jgi:hypothetical protein
MLAAPEEGVCQCLGQACSRCRSDSTGALALAGEQSTARGPPNSFQDGDRRDRRSPWQPIVLDLAPTSPFLDYPAAVLLVFVRTFEATGCPVVLLERCHDLLHRIFGYLVASVPEARWVVPTERVRPRTDPRVADLRAAIPDEHRPARPVLLAVDQELAPFSVDRPLLPTPTRYGGKDPPPRTKGSSLTRRCACLQEKCWRTVTSPSRSIRERPARVVPECEGMPILPHAWVQCCATNRSGEFFMSRKVQRSA